MSDLACTAHKTEAFGDASTRADAQRACAEASAEPGALWCHLRRDVHYDRKIGRDYATFFYYVRFDGRQI